MDRGRRMNEPEVVSELQKFLRAISRVNKNIRMVVPDGFYGPETEGAVRDFQSYYGLPDLGTVDERTWEAIYDIYRALQEYQARSEGIYPFETVLDGGRVLLGERSDMVYIIQIILETINPAYNFNSPTDINGYYDDNTYRNIRHFQRVNGLPETGVVDKPTWNMLAKAYNKYHSEPQ